MDLYQSPLPSPLLRKQRVYSARNLQENPVVISGQSSPNSWSCSPSVSKKYVNGSPASLPGSCRRKRVRVVQELSQCPPERKISPSASPVQLHAKLVQQVSAVSALSTVGVSKSGEHSHVQGS